LKLPSKIFIKIYLLFLNKYLSERRFAIERFIYYLIVVIGMGKYKNRLERIVIGNKEYFVLYRSEPTGKKLNLEEAAGQFGCGVYFADSAETARQFNSEGELYRMLMPTEAWEEIEPVVLSKRVIERFENAHPYAFEEYVAEHYPYNGALLGPIVDDILQGLQVVIKGDALLMVIERCLFEEYDTETGRWNKYEV